MGKKTATYTVNVRRNDVRMRAKRVLMLIPLLFSFVACIDLFGGEVATAELIDCGTNMQCFAQAAGTCTPAKVTAPMNEYVDAYMEIRGGTPDACEFYARGEKLTLPEDVPDELRILESTPQFADMTCTLPVAELSTTEFDRTVLESCSGPMAEILKHSPLPSEEN